MIGLDTNILVRFLTKDDEKQFQKTYQLLVEGEDSFMISYPTLVELVWVLSTRYKYSKKELIFILQEFKNTKNFYFPDRSIVEKAIADYNKKSADFADCLIGILNKENDCDTTYTFDKQASKLSSFTLLD